MMRHPILIFVILLKVLVMAGQESKNHVALDPFLPIFGTVQLQYERAINDKLSVALSVGGKLSSGLFSVNGIDTERITTDDFNFKGIKIIPEFRWYVDNRVPGLFGFYVGGYYKYQHFTEEVSGTYLDNAQNGNPILLDAKIRSSVLGLQLGYKLRVFQKFFVDFIIMGPGASFSTFELAEKIPIPDAFYEDLSNAVSKYAIFESLNTNFKIDANQKRARVVLPAYRYGIKLGYAF